MAYFDTSVLVPLFVPETSSPVALAWLARSRVTPRYVSEWTRTELVSAISGKVRVRVLTADAARETLAIAAAELASAFQQVTVEGDDFSAANALLERFELGLRAGDALHLAMAQRLREPLVTFDRRLAAAAEAVGVAVVVPG